MSEPVELASDEVRLLVLPELGGKIASIEHRTSGREWLLAPPQRWPAPPPYGSSFTAAPLWGWDEMVPTIDACRDLPDHGEAWALPWSAELRHGALRCAVEGRALSYPLERTVAVNGAAVTLDYELRAPRPLRLLWAAHPQFVLDPGGTGVVVPAQVEELVEVTSGERPAGVETLADPLAELAFGTGRKLYVAPDTAVDRVELRDRSGPWLRMRWDAARLPYLGVWIDNGAFAPQPVVALEPANGYYDSLERAERLGRVAAVTPDAPLRWSLRLELGVV